MGPRIFVGVTGGSGARFAAATLAALAAAGCDVGLAVSDHGVEVIAHELYGLTPKRSELDGDAVVGRLVAAAAAAAGPDAGPITVYANDDYRAPHASGSGLAGAALVIPCSMASVGAIAAGLSTSLVQRAADVMLKERRPLVLCPRETPLSTIHLENLLRLSRAGAIVAPLAPGYYQRPTCFADLDDFVTGKLLTLLGVPQTALARWGE